MNLDAFGTIPYDAINHAADGVCRARGWHTAECGEAQEAAQAAITALGTLAVGALVLFGLAALFRS